MLLLLLLGWLFKGGRWSGGRVARMLIGRDDDEDLDRDDDDDDDDDALSQLGRR